MKSGTTGVRADASVMQCNSSSFYLKEKLHIFGVVGCILCVVGSTTIVLHAPHERDIESVKQVWHLATQPVALLIFYFVPRYGKTHLAVYVGVCSLMGSITINYLNKEWDSQNGSQIATEMCGNRLFRTIHSPCRCNNASSAQMLFLPVTRRRVGNRSYPDVSRVLLVETLMFWLKSGPYPLGSGEWVIATDPDVEEKWKKPRTDPVSSTEEYSVMMVPLKDIVPAPLNNIDTRFILLDKGKITMEGQSKTCLALVADETAAVHFLLWGGECDAFQPGDIIQLSKGIFSYQRKNLVLRAGKRGKIEKVAFLACVLLPGKVTSWLKNQLPETLSRYELKDIPGGRTQFPVFFEEKDDEALASEITSESVDHASAVLQCYIEYNTSMGFQN
ncbi:hypothetical protein Cgig2_028401 [Carnegiea gigantea]|uniref:Uncharacterized protein n=1 Tax=Carnegiea gigantea TaxID=171969 RepID=A0A9Q1K1S8_9CARY|nr:hypothetical protein Cgig2_028401 [Carnegiea gigantea]